MPDPRPASRVPETVAGIPSARSWIDLRLDGNQGRAPFANFWTELLCQGELLRSYPTDPSLERALAERHGLPVDRFFIAAGADDVLDRVCRATLEPGRQAILPVPTFEMLERYIAAAGGEAVRVPWPSGDWPRGQVLQAITPATALIAIVSPNNPTGLCARADDVRDVCERAPGAVVLVDAAYAEFGGEDLTEVAKAFPNTVVARTFSKAFGLAGLRVGYAIAAPRLVSWLRSVGSPFTCGTWSRAAAVHRLAAGQSEVEEYVQAVAAERQSCIDLLTALGVEPLPSAGNFVYVRTAEPLWLRDALAGLGIAVRAFADGVRITLPGHPGHHARLTAGLQAALRPKAMLFDLDGVLADIEGRRALAAVADLQALAAELPIGVVTSCPRRLAEAVLDRHGFLPHVQVVVGSEDGPGKPDPAPVRLCLERLGQASAWLLGDNPGDLVAARKAGVVPLAMVPHGIGSERLDERLRQHGAARLIEGLADLRRLLASLPRG